MNQLQQIPKPWMQNWVSTCDVEVWQPVHTVRHIHNVVERLSEILPLGFANFMITIGKDIAMPTTLVALVGNMPLKCKILFHNHKNLRAKDRIYLISISGRMCKIINTILSKKSCTTKICSIFAEKQK